MLNGTSMVVRSKASKQQWETILQHSGRLLQYTGQVSDQTVAQGMPFAMALPGQQFACHLWCVVCADAILRISHPPI